MLKSLTAATLATVALAPMAAQAQDTKAPAKTAPTAAAAATVNPTVGVKVFDPQGGEVGTVEKISGTNAVVFTGTKRATLPFTAMAKNAKGQLLISMTKPQLEAAVAAAEAKTANVMDTALVADAPIKSKDGQMVGTVQKVEGDNVTINLADGNPVTVTKQYLTAGADGSLMLTMTADAFQSAVAAATQSGTSAPASADATASTTAQTAATEAPSEE